MGRDKAFVRNRGEALVTRACRALEAGGAAPVLVVGGDRERVEGLGLAYVEDRYTKAGPLGGIITALEHLSTDLVVVLACDHLYPSARAVRSVVDAIGPADVAVPMSDGRAQWLHAVWRTTALPSLIEHYRRGVRAPRLLAEGLDVVWAPGGEPRWYRDADRPEDLPPEGAH